MVVYNNNENAGKEEWNYFGFIEGKENEEQLEYWNTYKFRTIIFIFCLFMLYIGQDTIIYK